MAAKSALAITIPSQASSGGLGRESGIAFSSTQASSSGYTLEGTKKTGMSVKTKRGTLATVRAAAEAEVNAPKAAAAKPAKGKKVRVMVEGRWSLLRLFHLDATKDYANVCRSRQARPNKYSSIAPPSRS